MDSLPCKQLVNSQKLHEHQTRAWDRVSVLTVTYKGDALTANCLHSLQDACGGSLPETVVVDNSPQKSTQDLVQGYSGATYIAAPSNLGFAGGNNLGLPYTTKEFILLLNNDTVIHTEPFTALLAFMDAHPAVSVAQGTILIHNDDPNVSGKLDGTGSFLTQIGICKPRGWLTSPDCIEAKEASPVFYASGAFFLLRRSILSKINNVLFYDHFNSYYEEVDLCHRIWLAGGEVWYTPTPPIGHVHSATFNKFGVRETVLRQFYRNIWFSFFTCFGPRGLLTIVPAFFCVCCGQILVSLFRGNPVPFRCHLHALCNLLRSRRDVVSTRKIIQSQRKLSDTQLFRSIMQKMSLADFLISVRNNL